MVKSKKPSAPSVETASATPTSMASAPPTIVETAFDYTFDAWMYALSDGTVAHGKPGDARIPAGMPFTERSQWGANQIFGRR